MLTFVKINVCRLCAEQAAAGTLAVGGTAAIKKQIEKAAEQTTAHSLISEETGTLPPTENYSSEIFSEKTSTESITTKITTSLFITTDTTEAFTTAPSSLKN